VIEVMPDASWLLDAPTLERVLRGFDPVLFAAFGGIAFDWELIGGDMGRLAMLGHRDAEEYLDWLVADARPV
jgi:hypothetical protein